MSEQTKISWCDSTINFWSGCTKVSPGCVNCYAEKLASRFPHFGKWGPGAPRQIHETAFKLARRLNRKPWVCDRCGNGQDQNLACDNCASGTFHRRRTFVNSMSDILDPAAPVGGLARTLDTIRLCPNIDFLLVTKRPELFIQCLTGAMRYNDEHGGSDEHYAWMMDWATGKAPHNVWMIANAEDQERLGVRVSRLLNIPAVVHGLSCEPLLGPIDFGGHRLEGLSPFKETDAMLRKTPRIDWVIAGGESGPKARPCNVDWVRSIKRQCAAAEVPCFVKQLGSKPFTTGQRAYDMLDGDQYVHKLPITHPSGADPSEWPEDLRVRQWPKGAHGHP